MANNSLMSVFGVTVDGDYVVAYYKAFAGDNDYSGLHIKELPLEEIGNLWRIYTKYGCLEYAIEDAGLRTKEMKSLLQMLRGDLQVVLSPGAYRTNLMVATDDKGLFEIKFLGTDMNIKEIEELSLSEDEVESLKECTSLVLVSSTPFELGFRRG